MGDFSTTGSINMSSWKPNPSASSFTPRPSTSRIQHSTTPLVPNQPLSRYHEFLMNSPSIVLPRAGQYAPIRVGGYNPIVPTARPPSPFRANEVPTTAQLAKEISDYFEKVNLDPSEESNAVQSMEQSVAAQVLPTSHIRPQPPPAVSAPPPSEVTYNVGEDAVTGLPEPEVAPPQPVQMQAIPPPASLPSLNPQPEESPIAPLLNEFKPENLLNHAVRSVASGFTNAGTNFLINTAVKGIDSLINPKPPPPTPSVAPKHVQTAAYNIRY